MWICSPSGPFHISLAGEACPAPHIGTSAEFHGQAAYLPCQVINTLFTHSAGSLRRMLTNDLRRTPLDTPRFTTCSAVVHSGCSGLSALPGCPPAAFQGHLCQGCRMPLAAPWLLSSALPLSRVPPRTELPPAMGRWWVLPWGGGKGGMCKTWSRCLGCHCWFLLEDQAKRRVQPLLPISLSQYFLPRGLDERAAPLDASALSLYSSCIPVPGVVVGAGAGGNAQRFPQAPFLPSLHPRLRPDLQLLAILHARSPWTDPPAIASYICFFLRGFFLFF